MILHCCSVGKTFIFFLIVVMAKGIGNGFPLGAVVTTPEVSKVMGGALYFNTYGGNPVSSAVGAAVIDVSSPESGFLSYFTELQ